MTPQETRPDAVEGLIDSLEDALLAHHKHYDLGLPAWVKSKAALDEARAALLAHIEAQGEAVNVALSLIVDECDGAYNNPHDPFMHIEEIKRIAINAARAASEER